MPKLSPARLLRLKAAVVAACTECLAAGLIPTERRLKGRFPAFGVPTLVRLRDEAVREGLIPRWSHPGRGLDSADRDEVEERRLEILEEKQARGEVPAPPIALDRVYRAVLDREEV